MIAIPPESLLRFMIHGVHAAVGTFQRTPQGNVPRDDSWRPTGYTLHNFGPFATHCPGSLSAFLEVFHH
jgi:hypothetical protein